VDPQPLYGAQREPIHAAILVIEENFAFTGELDAGGTPDMQFVVCRRNKAKNEGDTIHVYRPLQDNIMPSFLNKNNPAKG
jgi:hypothetical protein